MRKIYTFLITIFFILPLAAASIENNMSKIPASEYNNADFLMDESHFENALEIWQNLEKLDNDNPNIKYKIGVCYLNIRKDRNKSRPYLEFAEQFVSHEYKNKHDERRTPLDTYVYLGILYRINYEFDKSLEAFDKLKKIIYTEKIQDSNLASFLEREENIVNNAIFFIDNPVNVEIVNMGNEINTEYAEHSPAFDSYEDRLYFTSKRPFETSETNQDIQENIYVAQIERYEWNRPISLGPAINTNENNEAAIGLSQDGKQLFLFRVGADDASGGIYYSEVQGSDQSWAKPRVFMEELDNTYRTSHISINNDRNLFFFTSTRDDGFGGSDIYMMRRLPNGNWGTPQILPGNINTPYDEETPFLHFDGTTLFFSSQGHNTMGGFDVFKTTMNKDFTFEDPVNLGYPVNSTDDDVAYILNDNRKRGYISSIRNEGYGDLDLYEFYEKEIIKNNLIPYNGFLINEDYQIIDKYNIKIMDNASDEISGIYLPDKENLFLLIMEPGVEKKIVFKANGYEPRTVFYTPSYNEFDMYVDNFQPLVFEDIMLKSNSYNETIYFVEGNYELTDSSIIKLNKFVEEYMMQSNYYSSLYVDINPDFYAYSDDEVINKNREEVVITYLVDNGVDELNIFTDYNYPSTDDYGVFDLSLAELPYDSEYFKGVAGVSETENLVDLENILFDFDRYNIKSTYDAIMNSIAEYLNSNPGVKVEIRGYTDDIGDKDYNMNLSLYRADAVKKYLVNKGNNSENIIIKYYGESDPVAPNRTVDGTDIPDNRKLNRRVEFNFLPQ